MHNPHQGQENLPEESVIMCEASDFDKLLQELGVDEDGLPQKLEGIFDCMVFGDQRMLQVKVQGTKQAIILLSQKLNGLISGSLI
jgi:hypothetical protein